ncbi:MAG: hypothetical protein KDA95_02480 [Acidimicrobiales bacterium]|nr:hypothetical protein [Acidimicrobiales bacterium]
MSKRLAANFGHMDNLSQASIDELCAVERIGERRAEVIRDELRHLLPLIDRLQKQGWRWTDENYGKTAVDLADLPLSGETVVITGSVPGYGRDEVNDLIERLGG